MAKTVTLPEPPPPEAPPEPIVFKIVAYGILLEDKRHRDFREGPPNAQQGIWGDVAVLPGFNHLIARWSVWDADGSKSYGYRPYSPDPSDQLPAWRQEPPVSITRFNQAVAEYGQGRINVVDPLDGTIARFEAEYPGLLEELGYVREHPEPTKLFEPGPLLGGKTLGGKDVGIVWKNYLVAHASGDFGIHGEYDHATLDDSQQFTLGLLPRNVRNSEAIRRRHGLVISQWPLPPDLTEQARTQKATPALSHRRTSLSPSPPCSHPTAGTPVLPSFTAPPRPFSFKDRCS